jgi:hypothetical protein
VRYYDKKEIKSLGVALQNDECYNVGIMKPHGL